MQSIILSTSSNSASRRRVYFNEYNVRMGRMCYLPLVSGLLRAFAETSETIKANFEFMPFVYCMDTPENILRQYDRPDVAAFSASMWNEQLNLTVAAEVKRRWPECLIVFGGPQVPHNPEAYFETNPFIDVAVRAEGEEAFADILQQSLESFDFSRIPGVSFRDRETGEFRTNKESRPFKRDLNTLPSPYLEGLYDDLIALQNEEVEFQAIIETNRGCPFLCTFCYWGRGGLTRKYRYHNMERVLAEIDWFGRNKIRYVFNADSNFGMHARDMEIAQFIVATKQKYGFPEKFRTCFGKNTDDEIFEIGRLFHQNGLEKGITLARQSNDATVLKNIKRSNIKLATYQSLQTRFNEEQIPIYTELILGLPGETAESWKRGIDELLEAGLKNQLFIYLCQVFPNTELSEREYQEKYEIKTVRVALNEIHGSERDPSLVTEYEDIIVSSYSMRFDEWKELVRFSWITMLLHSMKLGFFIINYLVDAFALRPSAFISFIAERQMPAHMGTMWRAEMAEQDVILHRLLAGAGRGLILPEYGNIYWDIEEAGFIRLSENLDRFYDEMHELVRAFLAQNGKAYDPIELQDVINYQRARIPSRTPNSVRTYEFQSNLPEYFDRRFGLHPIPHVHIAQTMQIAPVDFAGERERFARETILWGRKSGTMLVKVSYEPTEVALRKPLEVDEVTWPTHPPMETQHAQLLAE